MASIRTADLVRALRARSGLSQHELAARAGMAQSAISDYERGVKAPSITTLARLAGAAGTELDISYERRRSTRRPTLAGLTRHRQAIEEACHRHGASHPRVFGSVARGTAQVDSDIDLLVDLEPGRTFFDVAELHDELVELLGRDVDVVTSGAARGRLAHVASEAIAL